MSLDKDLLDLAANRFKVDATKLSVEDDFFDKLGINSYQAMDLLTEIEDHYDIEVPDYELQGVSSFKALAEVIARRL